MEVSQEMGSQDGAAYNNDPNYYDYAEEYGYHGHTGVDYATPVGTPINAPISGTVVNLGGQYYGDPYGIGDVRIQADNGDIIILGHMRSADLKVGQKVTAGDLVGTSGQSDQRPDSAHLHLEVRVLQPDGTYKLADPEEYFS